MFDVYTVYNVQYRHTNVLQQANILEWNTHYIGSVMYAHMYVHTHMYIMCVYTSECVHASCTLRMCHVFCMSGRKFLCQFRGQITHFLKYVSLMCRI